MYGDDDDDDDDRLLSCIKNDFEDGNRSPSWILKVLIFDHVLSSGSISVVVHQISWKSDNFSLRYGDLTIFKMAAVRHLGF